MSTKIVNELKLILNELRYVSFSKMTRYIVLMAVGLIILYASIMTKLSASGTPWLLYVILIYVVFFAAFIFASKLTMRRKIVLWLSTMVVWFAFVTPPFDSPDEDNHFYRTLHIYDGNWLSPITKEGATLTKSADQMDRIKRQSIFKTNFNDLKLDLISPRIESTKVLWTSYNISLFYIPSLIGVIFANLFGLSLFWLLIFARLVNGFTYIWIVYHVLKLTQERYKWIFAGALTIPFFVFLGGTVNLDALSLALTCLALAYWLRYVSSSTPDKRDIYKYIGLIIFVALSKLPYILLLGLILPLKFLVKKEKIMTIGVGIVLTMLWFTLARTANTGMYINANPVEKLKSIFLFGDVFRGYIFDII